MKQNKIIINLIVILLIQVSISKLIFQRIIWTYWNNPISNAPLIVQLSYEKIKLQAEKGNWTMYLLNDQTLKDHITDFDVFQQTVKQATKPTVVSKSDLLRIMLVQQHGGIWFDFVSIVYNDLNWLDQIDQKYANFAVNKYGSNDKDPDVLFFTEESYYQSQGVRVENNNFYNEYPAIAVWFIAAKKKSQLMTDWKNKYLQMHRTNYKTYYQQLFVQQEIFVRGVNFDGYFSAYHALYYVIQKKQRQLDKNLTLFSEKKSVFQYYRLWTMMAHLGPTLLTRLPHQRPLFEWTFQQLQQKYIKVLFFLKVNGYHRPIFDGFINKYLQIFHHQNQTMQNFIQKSAKPADCGDLVYITQGSVIQRAFRDIKINGTYSIPVITTDERQLWREYCSQFQGQRPDTTLTEDFLSLFEIRGDSFYFNTIMSSDKNMTFAQKTKTYLKDIELNLRIFNKYMAIILVSYLVLKCILTLSVNILRYIIKQYVKDGENIQLQESKVSLTQIFQDTNLNTLKSSLIILGRLFSVIITISLYMFIDPYFQFPKPKMTLIVVLLQIGFNKLYDYYLDNQNKSKNTIYQRMFEVKIIYYIVNSGLLCYVALTLLEVRTEALTFHSVVIGMVGPCLYSLLEKILDIDTPVNIHFKKVLYLKNYHQYIVAIYIFVLVMMSNARFLTVGDQYLTIYTIYLPLIYVFGLFSILSLLILANTIRILSKKYDNLQIKILKLQKSLANIIATTILFIATYQSYLFQQEKYMLMIQKPRHYYTFLVISFYTIIYVGINFNIDSSNLIKKFIYQNKKYQVLILVLSEQILYNCYPLWILCFGSYYTTAQKFDTQSQTITTNSIINIMLIIICYRIYQTINQKYDSFYISPAELYQMKQNQGNLISQESKEMQHEQKQSEQSQIARKFKM